MWVDGFKDATLQMKKERRGTTEEAVSPSSTSTYDRNFARFQRLELGTEKDRASTPIAEERMVTKKEVGSPDPPIDTEAWFWDNVHDSSGLSTTDTQHTDINSGPLEIHRPIGMER